MTSRDIHDHAPRFLGAHFAGRIAPGEEAALRAHLPGCDSCRRLYERHLLLARLDPAALSPRERLWRGLGVTGRRAPRWRLALLPIPLLAVAALALLVMPRQGRRPDGVPDFAARGAGAPPALWIYRVFGGAAPQAAQGSIRADDELAFAYANPGAAPYVMVFAVDEHRHIYWFHPGWAAGAPAPRSLAARAGPGPHELPAAIRHALDGTRVVVYGWFSRQPAEVAAVERAVQAAPRADALDAPPGTQVVRRELAVTP